MKPLVSIIIVNYNGYHLLKNCISSILKNDYLNYEIIIADNGSTDKSVSKIKKDFSKKSNIKIVDLKKNIGPSAARNKAFKLAEGEIIGFLDNDTEVDRKWITQAVNLFNKNPKTGIIQCKLLLLEQKNKIDYVGERLGSLGFLRSIAPYGALDQGQYDKNNLILAAKSAGMFITKKAFVSAGKFDPDYFIFLEETDLGWRAWLNGFQNIFCPQSIVYHKFSSTKDIVNKDFNNYLVRFHGTKNYIQTLIKNLSLPYLIKILPRHIFLWFSLATYLLITGKTKSAINIYKGIFWNLINISETLSKRKIVQTKRKISDKKLFVQNKLKQKSNLSHHMNAFFSSQKKVITPENN